MSYYGMDDPQASANGFGRVGRLDPQAAANGFGAYFTQQAPVLPMQGLGEEYYYTEADGDAAAAAVGTVWLVARAAGGYLAGRAMAPNAADSNTWGVVGAILGTLGGPFALGLVGLIAMKGKS